MTRSSRSLRTRLLCAIACAFATWGLGAPVLASAQPEGTVPLAATYSSPQIVSRSSDGTTASLETTSFAIPLDSPYAFTGRVTTSKRTDSVTMRLNVYNPSGKLMTQRTRIVNDPDHKETSVTFERETADLALSPGAYPVTLEVRVSEKGTVTSLSIDADLLIYDPDVKKLPVVFAVRISGQPLADPEGRFIADPGQYTRARDDAREIAAWVLDDPQARVTLAISPLLLEEWKRISQGYEFAGPEGTVSVASSETVPVAYAQALDAVRRAIDTGRLELAGLGYADPDLSDLVSEDLAADVGVQYAAGISAVFASIESTPSTGTIPAGGCVPASVAASLTGQNVGYTVLSPDCTRSGDTTAAPGLYRIKRRALKALVSDTEASAAVHDGDSQALLARLFEAHAERPGTPLVVTCDVGAGQTSAGAIVRSARILAGEPWISVRSAATAAAPKPKKTISVKAHSDSADAPSGYWTDVSRGRAWAGALTDALGEGDTLSASAERDSLVAQCSAWAGTDGTWSLADRGRSFATTAERTATDVLDTVELSVEQVTLAGATGDIPVTITNGSDHDLTITLTGTASQGVRIEGSDEQRVTLPPQDTFIEIPVAMSNALSGRVTLTVSSGGLTLASRVVPVRASYLDRLAMIAGVVVVLGVLLFIIVRRARTAEPRPAAGEDGHFKYDDPEAPSER